jgi:hypothetical protein
VAGGRGDAVGLGRVLDEGLATIDPDGATYEVTSQLAWRWASCNVESDDVTVIDTLEPATSDLAWFSVEGRVHVLKWIRSISTSISPV